ncbi:MAG: lysophospholipid acyltransferase family protein [Myxococcota bacterium]
MGPLRMGRAVFRAASFGTWTSLSVAAYRAWSRLHAQSRTWEGRQRAVARWAKGVVPLLGVDLEVQGEVPDGGPYLVVSNHRSPIDILLGLHLVGGVVLAHNGVASIPVVGNAARVNDTIFVDQEDRVSGANAVRSMRRHLRDGHNVIVFPEGNTFAGDDVRPFQGGAFAAARGLDAVRVLPMGLAYDAGCEFVDEPFGRHLMRNAANPKTYVSVRIGAPRPVPARGEELHVRNEVQALVDEAAQQRDLRLR